MGSSENGKTVPVAAVWRECSVPPVHATAPASKTRALVKYGHLKTRIGILCNVPAPRKGCKEPTWLERAVTRVKKEEFEALLKDTGTESDASGVRAQGVVSRAIWLLGRTRSGYRPPSLAFAQAKLEEAPRGAGGYTKD